jgi:hypothetical protein
MSSLLAEGEASSATVASSRYSAYFLYWYKSTNTDAEGAAGGSGLVQKKAGAGWPRQRGW